MEDNTILIVLGVILSAVIYGAYSGLVLQYPNVLVLLLGAIIVYLFILETEFRQLAKIANKIDREEVLLTKTIKDLREEVSVLRDSIA